MGYGIFGQKITGIRDIKTPPNGASINTHKKQHKTKQKQRERKNYIIWIRKCQTPAKSAPTAGFLTVLTTILASAVDHVIMGSCKIKNKIVTPISVKQISSLDFSRLSQIIYSLQSKLLRLRCDLRLRLSSIDEESISFPESALLCQPERAKGSRPLGTRLMKSGRHFDAFHWEPMKLSQINHVIW